jgi:hypothetical protein
MVSCLVLDARTYGWQMSFLGFFCGLASHAFMIKRKAFGLSEHRLYSGGRR